MRLRNIALDNLKRRKSKMVFLIMGMMIGVATVVALSTITSSLENDVQKKLDEFGADIMIIPKANTLAMSYGGMSIPGAQYDIQEIQETEVGNIYTINNSGNIATVSPKLLGALKIENTTVLLVGAELATEISLKKWWKFTNDSNIQIVRTEKPSPIDPTKNTTITQIEGLIENDLIIGSNVAEKIGKRPGDTVTIQDKEFNIRAVIQETGSQDDSIVFMTLSVAQKLLGKEGKITMIEVAAICSGCPAEEIARQINEVIPEGKATPIKQVVEARMRTMRQITNFGLAVGVIVLAIGSLMVFTTMMSSVNERTREIGIFRAIGFRRSHILKLIFMEAIILSFIAGVLGYAFGVLGGYIIGPKIADITITEGINPYTALFAVMMAVIVGTLATIYPAMKASRIDPVEALRQI
ncbi:MAG: FtsX-like permease family protein [Methanobacteriota archaeon]